jgi:hypothetical protein
MARPQPIQNYLRGNISGASKISKHAKEGAIDLDYPRKADRSKDVQKTKALITYLKNKGYKVLDHNNHLHVNA